MATDADTVLEPQAAIVAELQGRVFKRVSLVPGTIHIGRDAACELQLPGETVSSSHADIETGASGTAVIDVGSTNGTWIDGERLPAHRPYFLKDGERFRIGQYSLLFRAGRVVPLPVAQPALQPPSIQPSPPAPKRPIAAVRPVLEPGWSVGETSRYLRYLPDIFQLSDSATVGGQPGGSTGGDGELEDEEADSSDTAGFLGRYLRIFEAIWEPLEHRQDYLAAYFDPRTCPESFLPALAVWLDTGVPEHLPNLRVRDLLASATYLHQNRGTKEGLSRLIEICTGVRPSIFDDTSDLFVVHIRLALPIDGSVDRRLVEALVLDNKPAHVGYVLELT